MSKWVLSLIWQAYIINLSKICFLYTNLDQMITLFFYKKNFVRIKALVLAKKYKNKLRTEPGFWNNKDITSEQSIAIIYIVLHVDYFYSKTLTLLSFSMTISFFKNIHLSNLFVYYTLDSQVSLSPPWTSKPDFFWISVVSLLQSLVL